MAENKEITTTAVNDVDIEKMINENEKESQFATNDIVKAAMEEKEAEERKNKISSVKRVLRIYSDDIDFSLRRVRYLRKYANIATDYLKEITELFNTFKLDGDYKKVDEKKKEIRTKFTKKLDALFDEYSFNRIDWAL